MFPRQARRPPRTRGVEEFLPTHTLRPLRLFNCLRTVQWLLRKEAKSRSMWPTLRHSCLMVGGGSFECTPGCKRVREYFRGSRSVLSCGQNGACRGGVRSGHCRRPKPSGEHGTEESLSGARVKCRPWVTAREKQHQDRESRSCSTLKRLLTNRRQKKLSSVDPERVTGATCYHHTSLVVWANGDELIRPRSQLCVCVSTWLKQY